MSTILPSYMSDAWKCYEQMRREDLMQIDPVLVNVNPEECHVKVLPFLAWENDVDISGLSEAVARKVIRAAINASRYAGTIAALKNPVEALSDSVKVLEWFNYDGEPYHFKIEIDSSENGLSSELITKLEQTAAKRKNVRSVLESIKISMLSRASSKYAATVQSGETAIVYPYFPEPVEVAGTQYMGAAYHTVDTTIIYPQGA